MAAGKRNGLKLRITGPDGTVHEAVSDAESVIVGSGAQAAVKILDPGVSNLHVMLKGETGGAGPAIDLGSEAGTQGGGQRVVGPKRLVPGDVLMVGGSQVEVFFGDEPAAGGQGNEGSPQGSGGHPPPRVPESVGRAPENRP